MSGVNWNIFEGLAGATTHNFERLCRDLFVVSMAGSADLMRLPTSRGSNSIFRWIKTVHLERQDDGLVGSVAGTKFVAQPRLAKDDATKSKKQSIQLKNTCPK